VLDEAGAAMVEDESNVSSTGSMLRLTTSVYHVDQLQQQELFCGMGWSRRFD
jgi:hypothetical protein